MLSPYCKQLKGRITRLHQWKCQQAYSQFEQQEKIHYSLQKPPALFGIGSEAD